MKKNLFTLIPALAMVFLIASCSKDDTTPTPAATPVGTWVGTGQYGSGAGNPSYAFTLNFKADGTVDITGNNNAAIDNATGTWAIVQDSVKATYTYVSASAQYTLSGKFTAGSNLMVGTIGLTTATSGVGLFSVTRQ
jgi:hypothetical protein